MASSLRRRNVPQPGLEIDFLSTSSEKFSGVKYSAYYIHLKVVVPHSGDVSGSWLRPADARWALVLAHGAGAGMNHLFLGKLAHELAGAQVATFRYQFPYMEQRRRVPDPPAVLQSVVRAAVPMAGEPAPDLPMLTAGKSLRARMTSQAAAEHRSESAPELLKGRGLVFFGLPLHPSSHPG